eukprot:TRINITY_DN431_c0_g1_i1.p1 TRINITY_DN431_c0_g1~~TRINITY_DN431_c0_g1_i1.p1  ORF type:complete len:343 (-),score=80.99 TRINITY_DN431_c0_g1_i1:83-1111(-)
MSANSPHTLKEVMADEELCSVYEEFLASRYAWENLGFYLDCEKYKTFDDVEMRKEMASHIFEKYLIEDAPFELGDVDPEVRDIVSSWLDNPPVKIFNILQQRAFTSMNHGPYKEFVIDKSYKDYMKFLQIPHKKTKNGASYDYIYKIILLGDSNVGKTSILNRFIKDKFNNVNKPTIGVEFACKSVNINGRIVKAQIWDTAGQEKYNSLISAYFRGANGAVVCYDVTSENSFNNTEKWLDNIREYVEEDIPIILVGNKIDLKDTIEVTNTNGSELAEEHNLKFIESSALDSINCDEIFTDLLTDIVSLTGRNSPRDVEDDIELEEENNQDDNKQQHSGNGCC